MKKRIIVFLAIILLLLVIFTVYSSFKKLHGTYKLDDSGLLGGIASAAGVLESLSFSSQKVTVTIGGGIVWKGTYKLDGTSLSISPEDGGAGLSGKVSDDKKTITIAGLKFIKE